MSRRENTERQILDAVEAQIKVSGMRGVGINAIAKRAGVSKELIYRYFDGMPGLILAWVQKQDFWTHTPGLPSVTESREQAPSELMLALLRAQIDTLTNHEALREIRRWELIEQNEASRALAERHERVALELSEGVDELNTATDVPAIMSVMLAGVLYLTLRSKIDSHFLGVPLRTEEGWQRIDEALAHILSQSLPKHLHCNSPATPARERSEQTAAFTAPTP